MCYSSVLTTWLVTIWRAKRTLNWMQSFFYCLVELEVECNKDITSEFRKPSLSKEAQCTTFLVKMSFICMRKKNRLHIKGWALNLVLGPGGTRKWPIYWKSIDEMPRNQEKEKAKSTNWNRRWENKWKFIGLFISLIFHSNFWILYHNFCFPIPSSFICRPLKQPNRSPWFKIIPLAFNLLWLNSNGPDEGREGRDTSVVF